MGTKPKGRSHEKIQITTPQYNDNKHRQDSINKPEGSATVASYSSMTISFETSSVALASTSCARSASGSPRPRRNHNEVTHQGRNGLIRIFYE